MLTMDGFARAEEADGDGPGAADYFGENLLSRQLWRLRFRLLTGLAQEAPVLYLGVELPHTQRAEEWKEFWFGGWWRRHCHSVFCFCLYFSVGVDES